MFRTGTSTDVNVQGVVRDGIADLLNTPDRLLEALGGRLTAAEADGAIRAARRLRKGLVEAPPAAWVDHLRPLLHRVVLEDGAVRIRIVRAGLRAALRFPPGNEEGDIPDLHDLAIPARITTRGVRLKLVIGSNSDRARREPDPALIKAISRAHDWLHRLKTGKASSVREIANAEELTGPYVSCVLRLAFLAPDIVEAILEGAQPVELTAKRLLRREDLPLDWHKQRRRLGFVTA